MRRLLRIWMWLEGEPGLLSTIVTGLLAVSGIICMAIVIR